MGGRTHLRFGESPLGAHMFLSFHRCDSWNIQRRTMGALDLLPSPETLCPILVLSITSFARPSAPSPFLSPPPTLLSIHPSIHLSRRGQGMQNLKGPTWNPFLSNHANRRRVPMATDSRKPRPSLHGGPDGKTVLQPPEGACSSPKSSTPSTRPTPLDP